MPTVVKVEEDAGDQIAQYTFSPRGTFVQPHEGRAMTDNRSYETSGAWMSSPKDRPHERPTRILVVDDNSNQIASITLLLKTIDCEVRAAHDGPAALLELREFVPDFALIDIGLPGVDGYDLARLIRSDKQFDSTVLIAQTGWGGDEDRAASRRAGFDYHLTKPLDFDVLKTILMEGPEKDSPK
jgi:CheY-like chemotaxis protein